VSTRVYAATGLGGIGRSGTLIVATSSTVILRLDRRIGCCSHKAVATKPFLIKKQVKNG
jgi:hypothetical protein